MIEAVTTRLGTQVPDLANRIDGAAEFSRLMKSGKLPAGGVRAYVLPLGLRGGAADAATGMFSQIVTRSIGILLLTQSVDGAGERALARLSPLIDEIVHAIAGWAPNDESGVFTLRKADLILSGNGLLSYQIEFAIDDQLRILT